MRTELIELTGARGDTMRGIHTTPDKAERVVLMLHGFERAGSTEPKYKRLADALATKGVASLRLDFSGCGLSDGEFGKNTVASYIKETEAALAFISQKGFHEVSVAAHSLAGCVVASILGIDERLFSRVVLIAPALNQKDVLRFLFAKNVMKKKDPLCEVTWENYMEGWNEEAYFTEWTRPDKMSKVNYLGAAYFLENKEMNYEEKIKPFLAQTLLVHGDRDDMVPRVSLTLEFPNEIVVRGGDHDLERPDMSVQWLPAAADFLAG